MNSINKTAGMAESRYVIFRVIHISKRCVTIKNCRSCRSKIRP
jgi:hypothetical protein